MGMFGLMKNVGSTVLHSNQPINNLRTVAKDTWKSQMDDRILGNTKIADKLGYKVEGTGPEKKLLDKNGNQAKISNTDRLKAMYKNDDGSWNKTAIGGTIAGGYMGVSAAGRIASGGGLYRDSDGNFDVIGVPLI